MPAHVDRRAVREVAAVREHHAEHLVVRVARLEEGAEDRHVGLRAGVRLHVRVLGAEQLLRPVDRELLGHVDELAAAVVAAARVALGVLVVHRRADRGEDGRARVVLRGDQAERGALALELVAIASATSGSVAFKASQSAAYSRRRPSSLQLPSFDRCDLLDPRHVAPAVERRGQPHADDLLARRSARRRAPPMPSTLASLCSRESRARYRSWQSAARTPSPCSRRSARPGPNHPVTIARSASPSATARAAAAQKAG